MGVTSTWYTLAAPALIASMPSTPVTQHRSRTTSPRLTTAFAARRNNEVRVRSDRYRRCSSSISDILQIPFDWCCFWYQERRRQATDVTSPHFLTAPYVQE